MIPTQSSNHCATHTQCSALIETLPNGLFPPELWLVPFPLPRFVIALTTIAQAILVLGKLYMGRRLNKFLLLEGIAVIFLKLKPQCSPLWTCKATQELGKYPTNLASLANLILSCDKIIRKPPQQRYCLRGRRKTMETGSKSLRRRPCLPPHVGLCL